MAKQEEDRRQERAIFTSHTRGFQERHERSEEAGGKLISLMGEGVVTVTIMVPKVIG